MMTFAPPTLETILVIDDETEIQQQICRILRGYGYAVLDPRHAVHALQMCKQHSGAIQLMVTDVLMPYMHGYALAVQARALSPGMRVLYISGYEDSHLKTCLAPGEEAVLLRKPFAPDELLRKIRVVLDAPYRPGVQDLDRD